MEATVSIYIRLIDYTSKALTSNGTYDDKIVIVTGTLETSNGQFIKVSSYGSDMEQILNIGSSVLRVGAGKIQFNPFKITKLTDAISLHYL